MSCGILILAREDNAEKSMRSFCEASGSLHRVCFVYYTMYNIYKKKFYIYI